MKTQYQTTVSATGGRNGHVKSEDGLIDFDILMPKELGGKGGTTNPEQLFAAGYAACFDSALNMVIGKAKVKPEKETTVTATVGIGPNNEGGFQLAVKLSIEIPGVEKEKAQELVEKAHQVCPYSNATRGNIEVELEVI
ncbi:organic hydroperoxide resistance protein [Zunongwangia profunda]|jgi:Ohr subfamily peroxiredoxin|uniref:organic hydroperoxide resistance protein n=1 Tax=Zunongwangia profunda TaxID=398743 RepID=UPI000C94AC20|nr:organic hydroperoxide resistance protein [Zunongwangia profunda]MAC64761.1 organic hydroperoxide resistance protein [Flavobacteriaceae bacterium]MCC4229211.1 organic hydroperoxide resistance protein [Zunongwangia profunda]|tara:strand:- start:574 stop:990 length:417 start_codon:yes stop_codon:yes gene_type:complete